MTRRTNSKIAGFTFLFYIAVAFPSFVLWSRATEGDGIAAKLSRAAEHSSDLGLAIVLTLLSCFSAIVLAVTLYGITRDEDHELAMMTMAFRLAEGVLGAIGIPSMFALLWLVTGKGAEIADPAIGSFLLLPGPMTGAPFFAVASLIFSYLLLRGRIVPVWLAWIGLLSSALVAVCSPLQIAGFLQGPMTTYMWFPMLAFEVPLGFWLIFKGAAAPRMQRVPAGFATQV